MDISYNLQTLFFAMQIQDHNMKVLTILGYMFWGYSLS